MLFFSQVQSFAKPRVYPFVIILSDNHQEPYVCPYMKSRLLSRENDAT